MISDYLNFDTVGVNIGYNGKPDEIATPQSICNDMASMFNYENCNKKLWADLYCKTGNTLIALKQNGINTSNIMAICDNKQSQMFACRKLYGKLLEEEAVDIKVDTLKHLNITRRGQVYYISNWDKIIKQSIQVGYNIVKLVIMEEMEKTMVLEFTQQDEFKINNIIMNPPYNPNDLYIDFALLAKRIASEHVVIISPGKCQAKDGEKNKAFRREIMPYIEKLVYYPDTFEIFDVREQEGIIYYIFGKEESQYKNIKVTCNSCKTFNIDDFEYRSNINQTLFSNKIADILNKITSETLDKRIGVKQSEFVGNTDSGSSSGNIPVYSGEKITGYKNINELKTTDNLYKYKAVTSVMPVDVGFDKNGQVFGFSKVYNVPSGAVPKGSFPMLMSFDTSEECDSFISYCNTKLVRFLYYIGICGKTIAEEFWRFVPDPGKFDRIFTDKELYKKYKLTDEEINIIESVIKERK